MGIISKPVYHEMEVVRVIRNRFAHHPAVQDFQDKEVIQGCRKLVFVKTIRQAPEDLRKIFTALFSEFDLEQLAYEFVATCIVLGTIVGLERQSPHPIRSPKFF
jgi:hypothetical protein